RQFNTDSLRLVCLQYGEVFFEVAKDAGRPFIIKNKLMRTEVLGTSFMIRSNQEHSDWNIRVKSGQVRVSPTDQQAQSYLLLADDSLHYNQKNNKIDYVQAETAGRGNLIFQDASMQTVVTKLAKRYKRTIQL